MTVSSSPYSHNVSPATLDELLGLDDEAFILAAYRTVLGREADQEGHEYYLRRIRNGIGKLHILGQLRNSKEARARSIDLSGLDRAIRATGPVRFLVCRGHETITEITSYDRCNRDQEEQEPEGAEAVPR
ncbi:DUF4214 domain-containing protein [Burkholderia cenocepacia]|uniref:DUF4214 domain-containing protein n=2 Tax=Burkholderia cenocepacia TaxID=95486 RepID=UPI0009B4B782|nr:DUF4214 domain-containing protein [Burkholderia cenocepacia]